MVPHILKGNEFGGFSEKVNKSPKVEGFVIDGWRMVGGGFGSGHLEGS